MNTVTYQIPNISCHHCVHTIKSELSDVPGVKSVEADVATKTATIVFDAPADENVIKKVLAEINYPAAG
ncbi:MAG: heavy-metal-associated domain-containing protein [Anaerolineales bacterium]